MQQVDKKHPESRYPAYHVRGSDILDDVRWNRLVRDLDTRLLKVEGQSFSFDEANNEVLAMGLKRLNEILGPITERLRKLTELGFLLADVDGALSVRQGDIRDIALVKGEQAESFVPSPFVALTSKHDSTAYAICRMIHYDRERAVLRLFVMAVYGANSDATLGPLDDWQVSALAAATMASQTLFDQTKRLRDDVALDKQKVEDDKQHVHVDLNNAIQARNGAQVAKDDTQQLLADFKQRYLGALTSLPVKAPIGTLAFDISQHPNQMKQMSKDGWVPTSTVSIGGLRQQLYVTKVEGETGPFKVDGGFDDGMVFISGNSYYEDYGLSFNKATSTFAIKLTAPLKAGTQILFWGYLKNDASDIYTKKETDQTLASTKQQIERDITTTKQQIEQELNQKLKQQEQDMQNRLANQKKAFDAQFADLKKKFGITP